VQLTPHGVPAPGTLTRPGRRRGVDTQSDSRYSLLERLCNLVGSSRRVDNCQSPVPPAQQVQDSSRLAGSPDGRTTPSPSQSASLRMAFPRSASSGHIDFPCGGATLLVFVFAGAQRRPDSSKVGGVHEQFGAAPGDLRPGRVVFNARTRGRFSLRAVGRCTDGWLKPQHGRQSYGSRYRVQHVPACRLGLVDAALTISPGTRCRLSKIREP
jgi:hypothetical protein